MEIQAENVVVAREVRSYLRWLTVFERVAERQNAGMLRWYKSPRMECYTRVGVVQGWGYEKPVVCLANIWIDEQIRGHGTFSSIVRTLQDDANQFELHRIEIECVRNKRLAEWLERAAFQRYPQPSDGAPSTTFYIDVKA